MRLRINHSAVLIFILLTAFLLRITYITLVPPSLNWDEASLGYNAYSVLKTGKDEWGRVMPVSFEAFGDYKLPGYVYTLVPFIAVFGLNDTAVRLPSILFGSLSIVLLYLLVSEITKEKKWAVLSALLLMISPWHFFLSRVALEANLALSFFLAGVFLLIKGINKPVFLIPSSLIFGLSIFTYNSARIFVPLFLIAFVILNKNKLKINKSSVLSVLIFTAFLAVGFYLAVFQDSSARYYWVRILDEGAINYLEQSRNNSSYSTLVTNLIYNKPVYFVLNFFLNYLKHFSVQFLAIAGGSNYQFSVQNMGLMYLIEFPFLLFGFFKMLKTKIGWIFLIWFLLAPIPSALTREAPHVLRSIFMLGALQVITAFGMIRFVELFKKQAVRRFLTASVLILISINFIYYLKVYFKEYPVGYSQSWQYGYKEAVDIVNQKYANYPRIFFSKKYGEPHLFYLFYSKYDPQKYQNNPDLVRYARSNWRWVDKLDKISFINDWEVAALLKNEKNALVITSPGSVPENGRIIDTIYFLDGSKAFEIIEI